MHHQRSCHGFIVSIFAEQCALVVYTGDNNFDNQKKGEISKRRHYFSLMEPVESEVLDRLVSADINQYEQSRLDDVVSGLSIEERKAVDVCEPKKRRPISIKLPAVYCLKDVVTSDREFGVAMAAVVIFRILVVQHESCFEQLFRGFQTLQKQSDAPGQFFILQHVIQNAVLLNDRTPMQIEQDLRTILRHHSESRRLCTWFQTEYLYTLSTFFRVLCADFPTKFNPFKDSPSFGFVETRELQCRYIRRTDTECNVFLVVLNLEYDILGEVSVAGCRFRCGTQVVRTGA